MATVGPTSLKVRLQKLLPLTEDIKKHEKAAHIGVKVFLGYLNRKGLFGSTLMNDLVTLHKKMNEFKVLVNERDEQKKKVRSLLRAESESNSATEKELGLEQVRLRVLQHHTRKLREEIQALRTSLVKKLEIGDTMIVQLEREFKAFYEREADLAAFIGEYFAEELRAYHRTDVDLSRIYAATREGLRFIIPMFEEITRQYYTLKEDVERELDLIIGSLEYLGRNDSIDFEIIFQRISSLERDIHAIVVSEEENARSLQAQGIIMVQNEQLFARLLERMIQEAEEREIKGLVH